MNYGNCSLKNQHISPKPFEDKQELEELLGNRFRARHDIAGNMSIFGETPDWNPAEMIGSENDN